MHIFPDLKKLEARFGDALVVIGVHSAKFDNEKVTQALRQAVVRYDLRHPVVNDAGFKIWNAYAVHAWPTLTLVDPEGRIAGWVSGEGNYETLARKIAELVEAFAKKGTLDRRPPAWALERDRMKTGALSYPGKIAAGGDPPRLYIADSNHHRVVVAEPSGKVLDVIGGPEPGFADGDFAKARFRWPQGVCVADPGGSGLRAATTGKSGVEGAHILYVADTENHAVRKIDLEKKTVTTAAGTGRQAWHRGPGRAKETGLNSPWDVALAGHWLYIAMAGSHTIWALDLVHDTVGPFAGSGHEDIRDGSREAAAFAQPSGLWIDGDVGGGSSPRLLYVADSESSAVRAVGLGEGGSVWTVAGPTGEGLFAFGDRDGPALAPRPGEPVPQRPPARFQHPLAVLVHEGKVLAADTYNHKIRAIDLKTHDVTTFLGTGKAGASDGAAAELNEPSGLARIGDTLYIADTNNHAIRACDLKTREVRTVSLTFPK